MVKRSQPKLGLLRILNFSSKPSPVSSWEREERGSKRIMFKVWIKHLANFQLLTKILLDRVQTVLERIEGRCEKLKERIQRKNSSICYSYRILSDIQSRISLLRSRLKLTVFTSKSRRLENHSSSGINGSLTISRKLWRNTGRGEMQDWIRLVKIKKESYSKRCKTKECVTAF